MDDKLMEGLGTCQICNNRPAIKTNSYSTPVCNKCALGNKTIIVNVRQPKRNDLCTCGSGKKYKKCCLKKNLGIK